MWAPKQLQLCLRAAVYARASTGVARGQFGQDIRRERVEAVRAGHSGRLRVRVDLRALGLRLHEAGDAPRASQRPDSGRPAIQPQEVSGQL